MPRQLISLHLSFPSYVMLYHHLESLWRYEYPATYISFREEGKKIQSYRIKLTLAKVKLSNRIGYKKSHTHVQNEYEKI